MVELSWNDVSSRTFCGKTINIKDYYNTFDPNSEFVKNKQINAKFIKFSWLDISNYTLDDERLSNIAVRADQNVGSLSEDISHSYKHEGWDCGYFPPIVGSDGVPRDGRTRIRAALACGEKFIPCAIYSYDNNKSVKDNTTNGLIANKHRPQKRASWQDFISSGVNIIHSGELPCDIKSIEYWLYNDVDIGYFYSNVGGNVTKLAKQIYDKAKRNKGGHLLVLRERNEWIEWLNNSIDKRSSYYRQEFGIQSMDDIAFYDSGGNRPEQVYCRYLLPNASKGLVTNIVLYSVNDDPEIASLNHHNFIKSIEKYHEQMYQWVNRELNGVKLMQPKESTLWRIVGVIPQFLDDKHKKLLKNHLLASMNDVPRVANPLTTALGLCDLLEDESEIG